MKSKRSTHVLLGEGRGKNLDMFLLKKGNFIMINEFRYGQTSKIWPSPLSESLYSTFNSENKSFHLVVGELLFLTSMTTVYG